MFVDTTVARWFTVSSGSLASYSVFTTMLCEACLSCPQNQVNLHACWAFKRYILERGRPIPFAGHTCVCVSRKDYSSRAICIVRPCTCMPGAGLPLLTCSPAVLPTLPAALLVIFRQQAGYGRFHEGRTKLQVGLSWGSAWVVLLICCQRLIRGHGRCHEGWTKLQVGWCPL